MSAQQHLETFLILEKRNAPHQHDTSPVYCSTVTKQKVILGSVHVDILTSYYYYAPSCYGCSVNS
jgi:hypothetical protein